jgi:hypothetical protein
VPASEAYRLGRLSDTPDAEAVFAACTALHTLDVLEALEDDLGKPVVTANQATMWDALRLAGVSPPAHGRAGYALPPGVTGRRAARGDAASAAGIPARARRFGWHSSKKW